MPFVLVEENRINSSCPCTGRKCCTRSVELCSLLLPFFFWKGSKLKHHKKSQLLLELLLILYCILNVALPENYFNFC